MPGGVRSACAGVNVYLLMAPMSIYFEFGEVGQPHNEGVQEIVFG